MSENLPHELEPGGAKLVKNGTLLFVLYRYNAFISLQEYNSQVKVFISMLTIAQSRGL